jgi:disulfide bond formation protein DsbB
MATMSRLLPHWPLLTLLFSAAMLAGAHAFQRFGGLAPCPLCLDQRNWHWGVVAVSLAALLALRLRPGLARWAAGLVGLALVGAAVQAGFHVAVENHWVVYQCSVGGAANVPILDLNALPDRPIHIPACDDIAWSLWGVSMAGWNALLSAAAALASFVVALWPERKP